MTGRFQFSELGFSSFERLTTHVVAGVAMLASVSCAGSGPFIWVNDVPDALVLATPPSHVVVGDIVSVRVFGQDNLSVRSVVRNDGRVSVPLIGQVNVVDRQPDDISKEIAGRLEPFVNGPRVMTVVEERHIKVIVAGEVRHPGALDLNGPIDVLTAISNAGGLTEFASESNIFVMRQTPRGNYRIRFLWADVSRGIGNAARFRLRDNDQVVVE